jgi:Recombinase
VFLNGGGFDSAPSNVAIEGIRVIRRIEAIGASKGIRFDRIDGGSFYIRGPHDVQILNSDWGPCPSSGSSGCANVQSFIETNDSEKQRTANVVVRGNRFHDFDIIVDGDHFECLFVTGGTNVTIEGNRFDNCETYGLLLAPRDWANFSNLVVRRNWFGRTCCLGGLSAPPGRYRISALAVIASEQSGGLRSALIQDNSFFQGQTMVIEGGRIGSGVRATGNIFGTRDCVRGVVYSDNVFPGSRCSASDRASIYGYSLDGYALRIDPARGAALRTAFRAVATGERLGGVIRELRRAHRPPPRGGWSTAALKRLLLDPVYTGGKFGAPGAHPALVSAAEWRKARAVLLRS